jgi:hypothetical protein
MASPLTYWLSHICKATVEVRHGTILPVTPKELAIELWGRRAGSDPKGAGQRQIRKVARKLFGPAPSGRWHFTPDQAARIRRVVA